MLKFICILLVALVSPVRDNQPTMVAPGKVEICEVENNTFNPGEQLTYKLYYNWNFVWIAAGEVVFKVDDLGDHYKFTARGKTYSSYEWFFKADDYFESIVNKATLQPRTFKRSIQENKYRHYEKVEFPYGGSGQDQIRTWTGSSEETAKETFHQLKGCTRDILTMIYAVRVQNFDQYQKGNTLPINVFLEKKAYNLNLVYNGVREDKKIYKQGKYKTHHLSPETIAGTIFKEDDRMNIWSSSDQNRVPLLIESPVSVGSIKAVLIDYKGLKYPFEKPK